MFEPIDDLGGINFVDGQVYWVADANGPVPSRK